MVSLKLREEDEANLRELVSSLFALQEERVFIYNEFDIKFKEYLLDAPKFNHVRLKLICKTISDQLNEVNAKILKLKERAAAGQAEVKECRLVAKQIEKLQANEEAKFKLVSDWANPKAATTVADHRFSPVDPRGVHVRAGALGKAGNQRRARVEAERKAAIDQTKVYCFFRKSLSLSLARSTTADGCVAFIFSINDTKSNINECLEELRYEILAE